MAARLTLFVSTLPWFALMLAGSASAQIVPPVDSEAAGIGQCLQQIRFAPADAAAAAEKRLAAGNLAPFNEIGWMQCLGSAKAAMGRAGEVQALAQRAQKIVDAHGSEFNDVQQAMALSAVGSMLQATGDLTQAMAVLHRVEALNNASQITQYKINAAMLMGGIYGAALNSPEAAEPYFRRARELSQGHALDQPIIDYTYAFNLFKLKRYDEARPLLDELAQKLESMPMAAGLRYRINTQRAVLLAAGGRHEEAATMFATSLAKQQEIQDAEGEAYTLIQIADHQWSQGQPEAAIASAQQAAALAQQGRFVLEEEDAQRQLAKFQETTGAPAKAFAALKRADELTLATLSAQNLHSRMAIETALQGHADAKTDKPTAADTPSTPLAVGLAATAALALVIFLWLRERRRNRALRESDAPTGLLNRDAMIAHLAATPAARSALLLVGVDKLDAINDLHGYETGDRVLHQLAARIRALCGAGDVAARWSDDSFLVAIGGITLEEAHARAEKLRGGVEDASIDLSDGDALKISVSVGVASFPFFPATAEGDWHDSLRLAARALQSARRAGANAWASIWGLENRGNRSALTIAQAPEQAAESGLVRLDASSPLAWQN